MSKSVFLTTNLGPRDYADINSYPMGIMRSGHLIMSVVV